MKEFLLVFAFLLAGFAGMALGRLFGRPPLRACGQCASEPCPACPHRPQARP